MRTIFLFLLFVFVVCLHAATTPYVQLVTTDPTGSCSPAPIIYLNQGTSGQTGDISACTNSGGGYMYMVIAKGGSTPGGVPTATVATLPAAPANGTTYIVTDSAFNGDCLVGMGSEIFSICTYNATAMVWNPTGVVINITDNSSGGGSASNLILSSFTCTAPVNGQVTCTPALTFDLLQTGTNSTATMTVGGGPLGHGVITFTGSFAEINANEFNGVKSTGTSGHLVTWGSGNTLGDGGAVPAAPTTNQNIRTIGASFGDFSAGAVAIASAQIACVTVPFAGTITRATLSGTPSGSVTVDVRTVAHASFTGPASTSTITSSDIPALSSATTYNDTTLTGWTTAFTANTDACFYLTSPTTVTGVSISVSIAAS